MNLKIGSLFSGVGGLEMGFERAGLGETIWHSEFDPKPSDVLAYNYPHLKDRNYGDITKINWNSVEPVDLICGGFPCQDVSTSGNRLGLDGKRTGLFFNALEGLRVLQPQWFVLENVVGLLNSNGGRDFETVIKELADSGYGVSWRVLDARGFGVPQRRRRVFIVGHLGTSRSGEVLLGPGSENDTTFTTERGDSSSFEINSRAYAVYEGARKFGLKVSLFPETVYCLATNGKPGQGLSTIFLPEENLVRNLSEKEMERCQGWPDDWTRWGASGKEYSCSERRKMIGNGVCTPVAQWIGERIRDFGT